MTLKNKKHFDTYVGNKEGVTSVASMSRDVRHYVLISCNFLLEKIHDLMTVMKLMTGS